MDLFGQNYRVAIVPNCFRNNHTEFKIDRTTLT